MMSRRSTSKSNISMLSMSSQGGVRCIKLTVTDLRASSWKSWPANKARKQRDLMLKDFKITHCGESSFEELRRQIAQAIEKDKKGPKSTSEDFIICDPDRRPINGSNVDSLSNDGSLILMDKGQIALPQGLVYEHSYSTVPHTRSVTNQEGKFYGSEHHNPAGFALAELVDNSLAATAGAINYAQRIIEIIFYDGESPLLLVLDNGCGMDTDALKSSLKYKAPKEDRETQNSIPEDFQTAETDQIHPIYANSKISKFGAGLKQAAFWLGGEVRIMTKTAFLDEVNEVHYSRESMEEKERMENADPWVTVQINRTVGDLSRNRSVMPPNVLAELEKKEKSKTHFTHIAILNLRDEKDNSDSPLRMLLRSDVNNRRGGRDKCGPSIEKQLAHVYFYYLHGRKGITKFGLNENQITISVTRYDANGLKQSSIDLADVQGEMMDLESQFHECGSPNPYLFTVEVYEYNTTNMPFKVGGIIRYHPYNFDRETHPLGIMTRKLAQETDTSNSPSKAIDGATSSNNCAGVEGEDQQKEKDMFERSEEFFHIWWNGRLIPHTRLESFDWCSPTGLKSNDKLYKSYGRISGSLFFDSNIKEITDNKLNMTTTAKLVKMFNEKTIGAKQSLFQRIIIDDQNNTNDDNENLKVVRMKGAKAKTDFEKWLKDSQQFDKEVMYSGLIKTPIGTCKSVREDKTTYYLYKRAKWDTLSLKVGAAVRLLGSPRNITILGRIIAFRVEESHCFYHDTVTETIRPVKTVYAPLSMCDVQLCPSYVYGQNKNGEGSIRTKEMTKIDKSITVEEAEHLIQKQVEELKSLKITINGMGDRVITDGDSLCIDDIIQQMKLDIVNADNQSINGHLPLFESYQSKKPIHMIAKVHKIHDDGTWELFHTTAVCSYIKDKVKVSAGAGAAGYFFKAINVKQVAYVSGKYVLTFRSYIDIIANNASNSVLPEEKPYTIEWEEEIDLIGRKFLVDGNEKIRLPYFQIKFTVLPGPPGSFNIDEFADPDIPIRVGQPFQIVLSFKDAKGNPTSRNLPSITSKSSVISVVQSNGSSANVNLTFEFGNPLLSDGKLCFHNVVSKGNLGGKESISCLVEICISSGNRKDLKNRCSATIHIGSPHKIECLNATTVENGCKPNIACRVLDVCGNAIYRTHDQKPIYLTCDIGKPLNNGINQIICNGTVIASPNQESQFLDEALHLMELKTGNFDELTLKCHISCESYPDITTAETYITVVPSTRPEKLRIYYRISETENEFVEIEEDSDFVRDLGTKMDIVCKLFDGRGKNVLFNASKHSIVTNWTGKKEKLEDGALTLSVPFKAENRQVTTKLKISGFSPRLKHHFTLVTLPLEPHTMKIMFSKIQQSTVTARIPVDQNLPDLVVYLVDQYGNVITTVNYEEIPINLEIKGDDEMHFEYDCVDDDDDSESTNRAVGSFLIKGVRFGDEPTLGQTRLTVQYEHFNETLPLNVVPGSPCGLVLEINDDRKKNHGICAVNNHSNVRVRGILVDKFKNPTPPPPTQKIVMDFTLQKRNGHGRFVVQHCSTKQIVLTSEIADFGYVEVAVETKDNPTCSGCKHELPGKCFGNWIKMQIETAIDGEKLPVAVVTFHLLCRPDVPFKIVTSWTDNQGNGLNYTACESFHNLCVTLEAEDGSTFKQAQKEHLSLALISENDNESEPIIIQAKSVDDGFYRFGEVPAKAGSYIVGISYRNESRKHNITNKLDEILHIKHDVVHSLQPEHELPEIIVSNDGERNSRAIVNSNSVAFVLKDRFGNICKDDGNGVLRIHINLPSGVCLENQQTIVATKYEIHNGTVVIPELVVPFGITLKNRSEHNINLEATLENDHRTFRYNIKFKFFDNVKQQTEIRKLDEEYKDLEVKLREELNFIKSEEALSKGLWEEFEKKSRVELKAREDVKQYIPENILQKLKTVDDFSEYEKVLQAKERRQLQELVESGSSSNILPGPAEDESEVLGRIGLLVQIRTDSGNLNIWRQLQNVISWHLQNNLLVTVTNAAKAHQLKDQYPQEQFMCLDIIKPNDGPRTILEGPGNPIYVRELLRVTRRDIIPSVQKVLNNVLGNTIMVDNLRDATDFMKLYNKRNNFRCPTLLTRDGHRLTGLGIIGGHSNTMPSNIRWKLGLAPSPEYQITGTQLKHLPNLKNVVQDTAYCIKQLEENEKSDVHNKCECAKRLVEEYKSRLNEIREKKDAFTRMENSRLRSLPPPESVGEIKKSRFS